MKPASQTVAYEPSETWAQRLDNYDINDITNEKLNTNSLPSN